MWWGFNLLLQRKKRIFHVCINSLQKINYRMSVQQIIFNKSTAVCTTTQTYDMGRHSCSSTHSTWALSPLVRVFSLSLLVAVSPSISTLPRTHPCILRSCFSELTSLQDPPTPHTDSCAHWPSMDFFFSRISIIKINPCLFFITYSPTGWKYFLLTLSTKATHTNVRMYTQTGARITSGLIKGRMFQELA